eukprot:CAMPEP_0204883118 /NCGR_PEP_ID=MMETSP1349-20130617/3978_1 /ASSEMBLY_ACC=CAM_ASM_000710 /TAXON_ID=215587 /ORGANISM="Aplanochytrium stocchinoi, Strain GSBS06" /LENGTH=196 /DNA_ID=CAMNT_0052042705 /DNA_START=8 /DNA_END=598 /DNA_ORIENTATION=+
MRNVNSRQYLEKYTNQILENLRQLDAAPSVQFQDVPKDFISSDRTKAAADKEADTNPDAKTYESKRAHPAEFYDDDKDNDNDIQQPSTSKDANMENGNGIKREKKKDAKVKEAKEVKPEKDKTEPPMPISIMSSEKEKEKKKKISIMCGDKGEHKDDENETSEGTESKEKDNALLPKKRPYPAGTECGGFMTEDDK